jgi:hypothetical protein
MTYVTITLHYFFEQDRTDVYNPEASELAREFTIGFMRKIYCQWDSGEEGNTERLFQKM